MIWFLAVVDLAAGAYLLVYAHRRERWDKPGVLGVGVTLVVCAALLGGLGTWQAVQEPAAPVGPRPWVTGRAGANGVNVPGRRLGAPQRRCVTPATTSSLCWAYVGADGRVYVVGMSGAKDDRRRVLSAAQLRAHAGRRMHEAAALSIAETATEDRIRRHRERLLTASARRRLV